MSKAQKSTPRRSIAFALLASSLVGCASLRTDEPAPRFSALSDPKVEWESRTAASNASGRRQVAEFVDAVGRLLDERRRGSASLIVRRHPDLTLQALRQRLHEQSVAPVRRFLAQTHSENCGKPGDSDKWMTSTTETGEDSLAGAIDQSQTQAERLSSQGDRSGAISALRTALALAGDDFPYWRLALHLELLDAQTGAKQRAAAWTDAAKAATMLLNEPGSLFAPDDWNRLSQARPEKTPWPTETIRRLKETVVAPIAIHGSMDDDVVIDAAIGLAHLNRGEPESALVAFKAAESSAPDVPQKDLAKLLQARSSCEIGQPGLAIMILTDLVGRDSAWTNSALSMLAAVRMNQGEIEGPAEILERLLESERDWYGKEQAETDLGTALLLRGDAERGMRRLDSAKRRYQQSGRFEDFAHICMIQAEWFESAGNGDRRDQILAELERAETRSRTASVSHPAFHN